jgi:glutathione S-transferase
LGSLVFGDIETMASVVPELMYFPGTGRANLTRLAFVLGNVEFTDNRVANWPEVKSNPESTPAQLFGSMPCIKHGDMIMAQSIATAIYACDLGIWQQGVLGDNVPANRALEVMLVSTHAEVQGAMYKCLFGDDASKEAAKAALPAALSKFFAPLEKCLERKTCEGPFFFNASGPTLADLCIFDLIESPFPGLKALGQDLTAFPKLVALSAAVGEVERIKAFASNGFKF